MPMSQRCLDQPAVPRSVRPGPETPALERLLRRPDLLERAPVVGRALAPEEPAAVALLEGPIQRQAAVEGRAGIRPAPLEVVDAEELVQVRRVLRLRIGPRQTVPPELLGLLDRRRCQAGEGAVVPGRQPDSHPPLPVPGLALEARHL